MVVSWYVSLSCTCKFQVNVVVAELVCCWEMKRYLFFLSFLLHLFKVEGLCDEIN